MRKIISLGPLTVEMSTRGIELSMMHKITQPLFQLRGDLQSASLQNLYLPWAGNNVKEAFEGGDALPSSSCQSLTRNVTISNRF